MTRVAALIAIVPWLAACSPDSLPVDSPAESAALEAANQSQGCGVNAPLAAGESEILPLGFGDLDREFRLHLPPTYDPSQPTSLVLDFHGYSGDATSEEQYTRLSAHADRHGYIVVYPQGTGFTTEEGQRITSWNDLAGSASSGAEGPICTADAFAYPHPPECGEPTPCVWATCNDDLGFIAALLDHLEATLCIDLDRIFAAGMSNGGMFVHRLGCDMPARFAAIAPVGGTLARGFNCAPGPETPVSLLNIYGSRDDYVSQKGVVSSDGYYYTAAEDVLSEWAKPEHQDCEDESTPYETSQDGVLGLECVERANCSTGAKVVHCAWDGAHEWPQDETQDPGNEIIWEFFSNHARSN